VHHGAGVVLMEVKTVLLSRYSRCWFYIASVGVWSSS
jgi:hypothetical protein